MAGGTNHGRDVKGAGSGAGFLAAGQKPLRRSLAWAGFLLVWVLPAAGQLEYGNLHATMNGEISVGYDGAYGNTQSSTHSTQFGGDGTVSGFYYNPNFLSFSVLPFYGRSQDNSDTQSISNSSGYNATANIFSGSHFPGYVSFNQEFDGTGTFGIPGETGLKTNTSGRNFSIGWNFLLPKMPSLSLSFSDGDSTSSLYGTDSTSQSNNRSFNVASGYSIGGFFLNGGFNHLTTNATITGLLEDGQTETTDGSSNLYHLTATRQLPFLRSTISMGFSRDTYNYNLEGSAENGTTDNANATLTMQLPRLPVAVYMNYTDNLFGNFEQQLASNGQAPAPVQGYVSPVSRSLSEGASTYYNLAPHTTVGVYVDHTEEYYDGQDYGLTQAGGTISFNMLKRLKGLQFVVGAEDTGTQEGNSRAGLMGSAEYRRYAGRWELETYVRYDQDVETLLVPYTTSVLTYGGSVKRTLIHDLHWVAVGTGSRSVMEQQKGDSNESESCTTMLFWKNFSVSGNYEQSKGVAILTATGLITSPVPGQDIPASNLSLFSGKSYGGSLRFNPTRTLGFSASYARSDSNSTNQLVPMNSESTTLYALATYRLRKLLFTAGAQNFRQSINTPGAPAVVTSYYFGISRWFKAF